MTFQDSKKKQDFSRMWQPCADDIGFYHGAEYIISYLSSTHYLVVFPSENCLLSDFLPLPIIISLVSLLD